MLPKTMVTMLDRRPQVMRDLGRIAVVRGALAIPGLEHRLDRQPQLFHRIEREFAPGLLGNDAAKLLHDGLEVLGTELRIGGHAALGTQLGQHLFEGLIVHAHHDRAEHLHQPAEGVVDEARVGGQLDHPSRSLLVQADVEHGVHHARHGELGAGAAGNQQRILRVAELLTGGLLGCLERQQGLLPHPRRELLPARKVGIAGLGGDGEPGGHGHTDAGHLSQIGALAAQQGPHLVPRAGFALGGFDLIETVHPLGAGGALLGGGLGAAGFRLGGLCRLLGSGLGRRPRRLLLATIRHHSLLGIAAQGSLQVGPPPCPQGGPSRHDTSLPGSATALVMNILWGHVGRRGSSGGPEGQAGGSPICTSSPTSRTG